MPLKIVRNDITKMNTDAIVNTANEYVIVGPGCDIAVYNAAGHDELLQYRKEKIGTIPEGEVFITPGFNLQSKYIIHAVSPLYKGGNNGEETKLRSCYQKSLQLAKNNNIKSIAFPLISTGSFGYPKEEGLRIAVDEINAFLMHNEMLIYLVVFGSEVTKLAEKIYPDLETYIDIHYIESKYEEEYGYAYQPEPEIYHQRTVSHKRIRAVSSKRIRTVSSKRIRTVDVNKTEDFAMSFLHEHKLKERVRHISDTFSQSLMYLIKTKKMKNSEVYKRAILDKKVFSKIKNDINYHPNKLTALCLCIGAKLNLDESTDLLARAGYALSPCDKRDIIFSYFIENEIYDMIELDIQLEEHGLPCIIE